MAAELKLLCAGAVQGLVKALAPDFEAAHGAGIGGRFGAVGAMKEALLAGEPCDLLIVTESMIDALLGEGHLQAGSHRRIGKVRTGIAVRAGEPLPDVSTPAGLEAALLASEGIYFPDPVRSTAGIHFAGVLRKLGLHGRLESRFHTYPNGATAMRELALSRGPDQLGCTQVTEINYTDGVTLVGALPQAFELSTIYSAAVSAKAVQPGLAGLFLDALAGEQAASLRLGGGFEPVGSPP
jgi:molybdate transport system substrate-binding protein